MQSNGLQLQPIFSSDCFGGGGMHGGGWGGRNNLADGEFNEERGAGRRLHLRMMQGLLAVRGGDHFLTAEATLFNSRAPATNALLCINAIVYLLQVLTQGALLTAGECLICHDNSQPLVSHEKNTNMYQLAGAKMNSAIVMGQYYRLLTPVFLHGGLLHLLCNALSLNAVGPMVETLFDTERMVFTYICGGIGGNVASFVFGHPQAMSVGASGTAS
jgi:membrane associated rhomboid family serine protease